MTQLVELDLTAVHVHELIPLYLSVYCPSLRVLKFNNCMAEHPYYADLVAQYIASLEGLRVLELRNWDLTNVGLEYISNRCTNLRLLDLRGCRFAFEHFRLFRRLFGSIPTLLYGDL